MISPAFSRNQQTQLPQNINIKTAMAQATGTNARTMSGYFGGPMNQPITQTSKYTVTQDHYLNRVHHHAHIEGNSSGSFR